MAKAKEIQTAMEIKKANVTSPTFIEISPIGLHFKRTDLLKEKESSKDITSDQI